MRNSGKWVVLGLVALAVCAAVGAIWYQYGATRRTLAMWGTEGVELIAQGRQVTAYFLGLPPEGAIPAESNPSALTLSVGEQALSILERVDLSEAQGLTHLRTALLSDASYQWDAAADAPQGWDVALRFSDGTESKTLVFSYNSHCLWDLDSDSPVSLVPKVTEGLEQFLSDYKVDPAE